jgi:hypothetical protein
MVGFSKTEVDDSLDLLLGELAAGEAVVVDGLATRLQRPRGWASQKVLYDAKRHTRSAQGLALSTTATCCGATAAGRAAATSRRRSDRLNY